MTITGTMVPLVTPGSAEWLETMSASKIAAVVDLSPYESRFALWHRMVGAIPPEEETDTLRRGHYLEPAVAAWFQDQHPEWTVETTGTWVHPDRDWQTASPDRIVHKPGEDALLECKTSSDDSQWGPSFSDVIPPGYRAQVMWQLSTVGVDVCHVAVLTSYLEFRQYRIEFDPILFDLLLGAAEEFRQSLADGEVPDVDSSSVTYQAMRQLTPGIEQDEEVELDREVAHAYVEAHRAFNAAEAEKRQASSLVLQSMGTARRALWDGQRVARRQPGRAGALASLVPERGLTDKF